MNEQERYEMEREYDLCARSGCLKLLMAAVLFWSAAALAVYLVLNP